MGDGYKPGYRCEKTQYVWRVDWDTVVEGTECQVGDCVSYLLTVGSQCRFGD